MIQAKILHYHFFPQKPSLACWSSYCIFCIKIVFLKPFDNSYRDIYESQTTKSSENARFVRHVYSYILSLPLNEMMTLADRLYRLSKYGTGKACPSLICPIATLIMQREGLRNSNFFRVIQSCGVTEPMTIVDRASPCKQLAIFSSTDWRGIFVQF